MEKRIKYIGLDVHKNSIAIAIAGQGPDKRFDFMEPYQTAWI